jgi:hypothetical protein
MREEAADAGRFSSKLWHKRDYPKIQILTIEGLLNGTERVNAPPQDNSVTVTHWLLHRKRESGPHVSG